MQSPAQKQGLLLPGMKRHALRTTRGFASRMETFRWSEKARSPVKKAANARLAELAKSLVAARKDPWALVLDAASLASSTALHGVGFQASRIIVPNDSDAPFGSGSSSKATVLHGLSLQDFLAQNARARKGQGYGPFSCVYCDFTECLYGSWKPPQELEEVHVSGASAPSPSRSSPSRDLRALFRTRQLDRSGPIVLAVTLAHLRSTKKPDQWPPLRCLVGALAAEQGWCSVAVDRLEQRAVATEFWVLGKSDDATLLEVLRVEMAKLDDS